MIQFTNDIPSGSYAEVPQTNPLRWVNLFRNEDGSFTHTSKRWKCKDFMNEIVRKFQGQNSQIYGFNSQDIATNEDGVWLRLLHLVNKDAFIKNLRSINSWASKCGYPPVDLEDLPSAEEVIIRIPRKYFENTYSISFLTYFIRVANVDEVVQDWAKHPTKNIDCPFESHWDTALKQGFAPPVEGYWYYMGKKYTDLKNPMTSTVHDCGVDAWLTAVQMEAKKKVAA